MINYSNNSLKDLSRILQNKKNKKIFILSGKNSFKLSGAKELIKNFLKNKDCYFYFKKSKYPEFKELKNIIIALRNFNPDLIIAIGGGSVLDYAKIANSLYDTENLKKQIIQSKYKFHKRSKLLAIPTTAGSGAEVTANAVIYINKTKYSVENQSLLPDYFLLFPELIINLKRNLKSSAGFDAIAQSIESMLSKKSTRESVNHATRSLKLSLKNYIDFLDKPNLDNTFKMCLAANYSGKAISISKTTAPHAISYPFTANFGINHGHAVSLTLNDFLKFNFNNLKYADCNFNLKERYKILFNLTKSSNIEELDMFIKNIKKKARLESNFKKLNINIERSIPLILKGVNLQRLSNNPVKLKISDLKFILKQKSY
jgi:alcohol dehydrogenase class IV